MAAQDPVQVELARRGGGQDLEAGGGDLLLAGAVHVEHADHDVDAAGLPDAARRRQHGVGLARAREGAEEHFQLAANRHVGHPQF